MTTLNVIHYHHDDDQGGNNESEEIDREKIEHEQQESEHNEHGYYYFHNGEVRGGGDIIMPHEIMDLIQDTTQEIRESMERIELLKKELLKDVKISNRGKRVRDFLRDLVETYGSDSSSGEGGIRSDVVYATAFKSLSVDGALKRKSAAAAAAAAGESNARKKRRRAKRREEKEKSSSASASDVSASDVSVSRKVSLSSQSDKKDVANGNGNGNAKSSSSSNAQKKASDVKVKAQAQAQAHTQDDKKTKETSKKVETAATSKSNMSKNKDGDTGRETAGGKASTEIVKSKGPECTSASTPSPMKIDSPEKTSIKPLETKQVPSAASSATPLNITDADASNEKGKIAAVSTLELK